MKPLLLFTDGSADPASGIGFGAYLLADTIDTDPAALKPDVHIRRFEATSSARLEIETVIWALREVRPEKITIYTDSQNLIRLPERRARLEKLNYRSSSRKLLKNAAVYREFFELFDQTECTFIKVKGHRRTQDKNRIEQIFTIVDRASRQALRTAIPR